MKTYTHTPAKLSQTYEPSIFVHESETFRRFTLYKNEGTQHECYLTKAYDVSRSYSKSLKDFKNYVNNVDKENGQPFTFWTFLI